MPRSSAPSSASSSRTTRWNTFVSYYDYYQPEAYIPGKDTYIEKDAMINDEIDKLRHSATSALFERRDVIIVASVSCIYSLGDPSEYQELQIVLRRGMAMEREELLRRLVLIAYERNDVGFVRGKFRVRGDTVEIFPASESEKAVRVEFFGDEIDRVSEINVLTGELIRELDVTVIFPATHYAVTDDKREEALKEIEEELAERVKFFESRGKLIEAQRIEQRTRYDLEMLREVGFCSGVENYSRVLSPPPGRLDAVHPARLLSEGLSDVHRRVARHAAAGARHVGRRPRAQDQPCGIRLPPAERL